MARPVRTTAELRTAAIEAVRSHVTQTSDPGYTYETRIPELSSHPLMTTVFQVEVRNPDVRSRSARLYTVVESGGEMILLSEEPVAPMSRAAHWLRDRSVEFASDVIGSAEIRGSLRNSAYLLTGGAVGTTVSSEPMVGVAALLAVANTLRFVPEAVQRHRVARREAMNQAAEWTEAFNQENGAYPTIADAYEQYVYLLDEISPGTRAASRARFVREFRAALMGNRGNSSP